MAAKELVQTITVGSGGAASIEFTGIPGTATDLYLVVSARSGGGGSETNVYAQFNGDSAANYSGKFLYGNGTSAGSSSPISTGIYVARAAETAATANTFGTGGAYIPNYSSSTAKSVSTQNAGENNATTSQQTIIASSWSGTAAITSIKLLTFSGSNFLQYTTASLYKITKGSGGATVA